VLSGAGPGLASGQIPCADKEGALAARGHYGETRCVVHVPLSERVTEMYLVCFVRDLTAFL
jgi:hypothetical protein